MAIAKSYVAANRCDDALQYLRTVASLSKAAYGAEARYQVAECLFSDNQLERCGKISLPMLINKSGSYELWVTKSYLLLGDIYFKAKKTISMPKQHLKA